MLSPLQTAEKCSLTTTSNQQRSRCALYLQKTRCQNTFRRYCTKKYRVMNDGYPPCMAPEDEEDDDEE